MRGEGNGELSFNGHSFSFERLKNSENFLHNNMNILNAASSVQFSCSVASDSVTPGTAAPQASLSITNSHSLLKLMSIESVMPSKHLILCHPLLLCLQSFPASRSFKMSQFFVSGGQRIGVSASASVLPVNIQD